jgi:hypothetical protein
MSDRRRGSMGERREKREERAKKRSIERKISIYI